MPPTVLTAFTCRASRSPSLWSILHLTVCEDSGAHGDAAGDPFAAVARDERHDVPGRGQRYPSR